MSAPAPHSPTPVPPADLADRVGELQALVAELVELTECGNAWGMRVLRRNIELAHLSPSTLDSAQNQLDFIEELAEAVWDGADAGFRYAAQPGPTPEETRRREDRRRVVVERLDDITHGLCAAAEGWRDTPGAPDEDAAVGLEESPS
ncbi:MAG TPA: hypothetical protein VGO86_10360 [Candidatus Dormibacteraeota bacterium]